MSKSATLRLRVTATAESILRSGHPWLFAESVREQNRDGRLGELAVIYDRQDKFLAIGLYDPDSPIRVRVLHTGKPRTLDEAWWRERLQAALARRAGLFDAETNAYRLINGESDGWPGLVLDRYDTTFVMKLYTGAWLPRLDEITALFMEALGPMRIVLRLSRNIQELAARDFARMTPWDNRVSAPSWVFRKASTVALMSSFVLTAAARPSRISFAEEADSSALSSSASVASNCRSQLRT